MLHDFFFNYQIYEKKENWKIKALATGQLLYGWKLEQLNLSLSM